MRPTKSLIDHVIEGTFRPRENVAALSHHDLPIRPPHSDPSPGMVRIWGRMRALQSEIRDVTSVEHRHDLALEFSRLVNEYLEASERSRRDPCADVDGLAEIAEVNAHARLAVA